MTNLMDHLWLDCLAAILFGAVAIFLMGGGYMFIDWILKRVDLQADVAKDNKSAAIVSASIFLSIAYVVATVFKGVLS